MTLPEAKQLNFPISWQSSAKVLVAEYGGFVDLQHDIYCWWYRLKDGQVRWKSYYLDNPERKDRYI